MLPNSRIDEHDPVPVEQSGLDTGASRSTEERGIRRCAACQHTQVELSQEHVSILRQVQLGDAQHVNILRQSLVWRYASCQYTEVEFTYEHVSILSQDQLGDAQHVSILRQDQLGDAQHVSILWQSLFRRCSECQYTVVDLSQKMRSM